MRLVTVSGRLFKRVITHCLVAVLALGSVNCFADVSLPKLVSSGMVLQRDIPVKVWGWAEPAEKIVITIGDVQKTTQADAQGNWQTVLPAMKAGGPYSLTIQGNNEITLDDVLVGDVWLASGQSNMELTLSRAEPYFADLVPTINNSRIRQFEVPDHYNFKGPQKDLATGGWKTATPDNIRKFSAVAYFFADSIQRAENVPIGIINASLGGSPVEAWLSEDVLKNYPVPYAEALMFRDDDMIKKVEASDRARNNSWYGTLFNLDLGIQEGKSAWATPAHNDDAWQRAWIPGYWSNEQTLSAGPKAGERKASYRNVPEGEGSVWFRKTITLSQDQIKQQGQQPALLIMGTIVDADEIFVNGEKIGNTTYMYPPRRYSVPAKLLKPGDNTIAVRVINNAGLGGFVPAKDYLLQLANTHIDLQGEWLFKRGATMPALQSQTFVRWKPGGLYNGLIAPLTQYAIKGVIWYQGESNAGRAEAYAERFPALINDWRGKWGMGDFPFLFVQLANYVSPGAAKDERGNWPELRQAQAQTLSVPNTAMVVTIDVGDWNDIHPLDKKTVGDRLAKAAQHLAYGHDVVYAGPVLRSAKRKGRNVILSFESADGLKAKGGELRGFELAGDDGQFYPAKAKLKGDEVVLKSNEVRRPQQVQYAWRNNPEGANLYNESGLPASPFRVDAL
ncbi:MAG TPA: sialate O-acetylesterase [Marinagarivorans sp.]